MATIARGVTGGVDTHLDSHAVAALDDQGALLGVESFKATGVGYAKCWPGWSPSGLSR